MRQTSGGLDVVDGVLAEALGEGEDAEVSAARQRTELLACRIDLVSSLAFFGGEESDKMLSRVDLAGDGHGLEAGGPVDVSPRESSAAGEGVAAGEHRPGMERDPRVEPNAT